MYIPVSKTDNPFNKTGRLSTRANPGLAIIHDDIHIIHRFYYGYDEYYLNKVL